MVRTRPPLLQNSRENLRARSVSNFPKSRTTGEVNTRLASKSREVTVRGESPPLECCGAMIWTQTCLSIHIVFIESLLWVRHNFRWWRHKPVLSPSCYWFCWLSGLKPCFHKTLELDKCLPNQLFQIWSSSMAPGWSFNLSLSSSSVKLRIMIPPPKLSEWNHGLWEEIYLPGRAPPGYLDSNS